MTIKSSLLIFQYIPNININVISSIKDFVLMNGLIERLFYILNHILSSFSHIKLYLVNFHASIFKKLILGVAKY